MSLPISDANKPASPSHDQAKDVPRRTEPPALDRATKEERVMAVGPETSIEPSSTVYVWGLPALSTTQTLYSCRSLTPTSRPVKVMRAKAPVPLGP